MKQNSSGALLVSTAAGSGLFAANGYTRVTGVSGLFRTGLYAADGSLNVVSVSPTAVISGSQHPCGALYAVKWVDSTGLYAPNGAMYMAGLPSDAQTLLGSETQGIAISYLDDSVYIVDTGTPANDYDGTATAKLTITGTLTASVNGAYFDASNHATLLTSAGPSLASGVTFMVEYLITSLTASTRTCMAADDGTTAEFFRMLGAGGADKASFTTTDGGVAQSAFSTNFDTVPVNSFNRFAGAASTNLVNAAFNGTIHGADDTAATMPTVTTYRFGRSSTGAALLGNIRRFLILPRRVDNTELAALSLNA